ncbi:hypothetical protein HAP47_0022835 [Bradyrhizobium sp. 41S5]|uniref:hypothetical protein n=1 Tax=Bradyrhizobium sp. 41S5 TaxID=1404443 RepID=UPI00156AA5FC|nr:hypothetical protein [Bradyrhizobium sp. 41S5]UFX42100.1 hypothetical protein HAP47_0022835 [Bradyrhizobium sp. 41S5]
MSPPRFVHRKISAADFDAELERQGLNRKSFARVFCQNLVTVNRWGKKKDDGQVQDIPTWVPIALTLLTLPGGLGTARMAAAAMIQQDRLHPELGEFPYQKLRQMPADADLED